VRQTEQVTQVNKQVRLAARPSGLPKAQGHVVKASSLIARAVG